MSTFHKSRAIALKWWKKQTKFYQDLQYLEYKKSNFTPARSSSELTGREIEIIFKDIKLSERAVKS